MEISKQKYIGIKKMIKGKGENGRLEFLNKYIANDINQRKILKEKKCQKSSWLGSGIFANESQNLPFLNKTKDIHGFYWYFPLIFFFFPLIVTVPPFFFLFVLNFSPSFPPFLLLLIYFFFLFSFYFLYFRFNLHSNFDFGSTFSLFDFCYQIIFSFCLWLV